MKENYNNDGFSIFGFEIKKRLDKQDDVDKKIDAPPILPDTGDDAEILHTVAGRYGQYYDVSGIEGIDVEGDRELIYRYRAASSHSEVDDAISHIVDEAIAALENGPGVKIVMDDLPYEDSVKTLISDEFDQILNLLQFGKRGSDYFRDWYIDGRAHFHISIDRSRPENGIHKIIKLDSSKLKKIREVEEKIDEKTGIKYNEPKEEYYVYAEDEQFGNTQEIKLPKDSIVYISSGIRDIKGKKIYSHLHKALKPINQLRVMEDSLVIYRLARAPERRIFYIDTGNLPKGKSEEYLRTVMSKYRNKIVYDASTGVVKDERKHMSMLEDFWLPRREGGRGTEISTLPGGENLGQIEDIIYFKQKLYRSLNIPVSRLEAEAQFTVGRATEISRDEVNFQKFINRLRRRFADVFIDLLRVQLQLKGIVSENDWRDIAEDLHIDYAQDNHFYELKEFEILQDRLNILRDLETSAGKYFSHQWIQRNVLKLNDEEIKMMQAEIKQEKEEGQYAEDGL